MIFRSSYGVTIDIVPWTSPEGDNTKPGHYVLKSLHIYEEICGELAFGSAEFTHDGSNEALKLITDQFTSDITIKDENEGGLEYKIPIFITNRDFIKNHVRIDFKCIKKKSFVYDRHTSVWTNIKNTITSLYPGTSDIRIETDIQDTSIKFYQNNETDLDFITRLCWSFKKSSVFSLGWEGLMIKETMGKSSHEGDNEKPKPKIWLREDSNMFQVDPNYDQYTRELYHPPYNCWEDTTGKKELQDYTKLEPINLKVFKQSTNLLTVGTKYTSLIDNMLYNTLNHKSNYYNSFRIKILEMPRYKIGDVIGYKESSVVNDKLNWPFNYFLVKSNELFISAEDVDEDGYHFSWTTKLLGLEDNGSVALGSENDPTDEEKK